jgi:quercetin dioxygenase-like cupin family protein
MGHRRGFVRYVTNERCVRYVGRRLGLALVAGLALGAFVGPPLQAQEPPIRRTDVLKVDMAGWEGQEANMWVGVVAPGAETGTHTHPTPRFVYVLEGAVTLEVEGEPPRVFAAGEGFQELPEVVHNLRNASPDQPARALGFQIAGKGEPLQR